MIIVVQQFLKNSGKTLETLIRLVFLTRFYIRLPKSENQKSCIILGNGPSLNESLKKQDFFKDKALFCVNFFPKTTSFEKLQPKYLVIAAPELWLNDVEEKFKTVSKDLFQTISNKVKWNLILFMPSNARKFKNWKSEIIKNKKIKLQYYNVTPVEGYKWFRHLLYKLNLGIPRPHNVLIPSLMISINMGFKLVYLLGADHSWLREITVNYENEVLINQKHFYDENTSVAKPMNKKGKGVRKLHEVLQKFYYSFASYFVINEYANKKNVKILNATSNSYIDAFERISMNKNKYTDT